MINQKYFKTVIFSMIVLAIGSYGYGGRDDDDDRPVIVNGLGGMISGGYDRETNRLLGKIELGDRVAKRLATQIKKLEDLRKEMKKTSNPIALANIKSEISYNEEYAKMLRSRQETLMAPTSMGMLVARGLVGKGNSSVLDDYNIDSILDGIGKGFLVRAASATGEVFSKKVAGTVQVVLGGAWDSIFGKIIDFWVDANSVLFHDNASAFRLDELASWKAFIIGKSGSSFGILEDIATILKDGKTESMRGHDLTLRQFDMTGDTDKDESKEEKEVKVTIWNLLMQGYAKQFDRVVSEFDKRKKYYKEDSLEVFYADQIQGRLLELRNLLLKATTLSELSSQIDSNRLVIVAYKNNIASMFERLNELIKPRTLSLDDKTVSIDDRSRGRSRNYYPDDDDDMPHSMSR